MRDNNDKGKNMYICVLTSTPDANDIPYDPSPYMNGYRWKQHLVGPKNVEKQIRDLMDEGVDVLSICVTALPMMRYQGSRWFMRSKNITPLFPAPIRNSLIRLVMK
ncbi:MAG: hypothetical protein IPJ46_09715 [Anaerolineales bacterium]|nr:hypothetical protein [Anaerolineales bacterium]